MENELLHSAQILAVRETYSRYVARDRGKYDARYLERVLFHMPAISPPDMTTQRLHLLAAIYHAAVLDDSNAIDIEASIAYFNEQHGYIAGAATVVELMRKLAKDEHSLVTETTTKGAGDEQTVTVCV
jgi:hypothetical protein